MKKNVREKPMDSNVVTREYFDEILVEMRHIDAVLPDTTLSLYGKTFRTPIMMAALSHLKGKGGDGDGMVQMAKGAGLAGCVNWAGMGTTKQLAGILSVGTPTIRIIKPYAEESLVLERIELAEELGALAVGMDLDHGFEGSGNYDNILGFPMRPRSLTDIKNYCRRTKLPFIVKGVLSPAEAEKCLDAGVGGIVISHHHSIMPSAVPPLMVLPEIARVINEQIPIFVDCGISNGADAFKALALGATAVSVGRPVMAAILEDGPEGAAQVIHDITGELKGMMARTCSPDISSIDPSLLWHRSGRRLIE